MKGGRLRPLALSGDRRSELMPEVPTIAEAGVPGGTVGVWYGVLAPAATPRAVIDTLSAATIRIAHSPEMKQRLAEQGAEAVGSSPEVFGKLIREEVARWTEVVNAAGIRAD